MSNQYSFSEFVKNTYSYFMTKCTMPQARFVRRPVYIRGRKSLSGCHGLTTGRFCRFDLEGKKKTLHIGKDCEMGDMTHIVAYEKVEIGKDVLIASKCFISDTNHGTYTGEAPDSPFSPPRKRRLVTRPVKIGDNVWIGENVLILAGASIGDGCIVGANSVITGSIPDHCIVVGNNKIIKQYDQSTKSWERYRGQLS